MYLAHFVDCDFYKTPAHYETELDKIQDELQDPFYVRKIISTRDSGWKKGDYKHISLNKLVLQVLNEAGDLFDDISKIIELNPTEKILEYLLDFKPLSKKELLNNPSKLKYFTYDRGSLLRIYGIRVGKEAVIITGAGIKLADKMQDSVHLMVEMQKMNYLINWLQENNITDCEQF